MQEGLKKGKGGKERRRARFNWLPRTHELLDHRCHLLEDERPLERPEDRGQRTVGLKARFKLEDTHCGI